MNRLQIALSKVLGATGVGFLVPVIARAQNADPDLGGVTSFVQQIGNILDISLPILVTLAVLAFFWGLAKFIFSAGDEAGRDAGKSIMFWGIIALFIMVSIWGIVRFLGNIFDVEQGGAIEVPGVGPTAGG